MLVLGLGIDNLAALGPVMAAGPAWLVAAVDDPEAASEHQRAILGALQVELVSTESAVEALEQDGPELANGAALGADRGELMVLRAPGYPRRGPECHRLDRLGARFTTAVDLWMGTHGSAREVVGITGTKGKSTVTSLLDRLLDLLGVEHLVGGNIGLAIWDQAPDPAAGVPAVIEVSSYMAADAHHPPSIGVLTSLDADHLTWHGSVEAYRTDKLKLFTGGSVGLGHEAAPRVVIVNGDDAVAADALDAAGLPVRRIQPGAGGDQLGPAADRLAERGFPRHLGSNLALAGAAAEELCRARSLDPTRLEAALLELADTYEALPSRHFTIGEHDGLRYIDDALASNPFAAAAALEAVGKVPVTWLIGGQSREVSLAPMVAALAVTTAPITLVGLPDTGPDWCAELSAACTGTPGNLTSRTVGSVAEAVRVGAERTPAGGVVLFAPGAPTPPRLGTYVDRAADFAAAFEGLKQASGGSPG